MNYRLFGRSGLRVSELCLGTMTFGPTWDRGASREESRKIFDRYAEAGGNFVDTANIYTGGTSESLVGEFVAGRREQFVVASKYTLTMRRGDPNGSGNSRKNMMQSLDASLKRLRTDYLDIYWVHLWDFATPMDEILRGMDDAVRQGKVLYAGISNTPAWIVSAANTLADTRDWTPFTGLQIEYSLLQRTVERDLIPMARAFDLAVTAWAPLAGGALTGKYLKGEAGRLEEESPRRSERSMAIAREVMAIAADIGRTPGQVALNWVRSRAGVVIPIVGARTGAQIEESLGCLSFSLAQEHLDRLDSVSCVDMGFPHDFLASERMIDVAHGGTFDRLLNHHSH